MALETESSRIFKEYLSDCMTGQFTVDASAVQYNNNYYLYFHIDTEYIV
jgi:hypothetical protein